MTRAKPINEASIKVALEKGLITQKEAGQMLRIYLQKSHFSPIPQRPLDTHNRMNQSI